LTFGIFLLILLALAVLSGRLDHTYLVYGLLTLLVLMVVGLAWWAAFGYALWTAITGAL
jgi:hypothetical protein